MIGTMRGIILYLCVLSLPSLVCGFVPRLARSDLSSTLALQAKEEGGDVLLEKNRRDLWKEISSLEREAMEILSASYGSAEEQKEKKVEAYKLLSKSAGLKKRDSFMELTSEYSKAEESGDAESVKIVLDKMHEIGLPPYIASLVDVQRKKKEVKMAAELAVVDGDAASKEEEEVADENIEYEYIDLSICESEVTTEKIRVKITTFYDEVSSDPEMGQYMFWYKVAIYNEGPEAVQIVARMWEIERYPTMEKEIVRGTGILQNQPIISPGDVFAYESKCPIKAFPPKGKRLIADMSGAFTACRGNMGQHNFPVKVGKVAFVLPMPRAASP